MSDGEWEKIGETPEGYYIYRVPNKDIGGYDYVSDSVGCGHVIINSLAIISELEVALTDMKMLRNRAKLMGEKK